MQCTHPFADSLSDAERERERERAINLVISKSSHLTLNNKLCQSNFHFITQCLLSAMCRMWGVRMSGENFQTKQLIQNMLVPSRSRWKQKESEEKFSHLVFGELLKRAEQGVKIRDERVMVLVSASFIELFMSCEYFRDEFMNFCDKSEKRVKK